MFRRGLGGGGKERCVEGSVRGEQRRIFMRNLGEGSVDEAADNW